MGGGDPDPCASLESEGLKTTTVITHTYRLLPLLANWDRQDSRGLDVLWALCYVHACGHAYVLYTMVP